MSGTKIKKLKELNCIIIKLKKLKKRIVFTNGCFDILHYGHVQYLEDAKKLGDVLIVGINSDSSIKRLKGPKRPIVCENDRMRTIAGLESVDFVIRFTQDTPLELIQSLKPDVLVKGADWSKQKIIGSDCVQAYGGKVLRIPLVKNRSTTNVIEKIAKIY